MEKAFISLVRGWVVTLRLFRHLRLPRPKLAARGQLVTEKTPQDQKARIEMTEGLSGRCFPCDV